MDAGNLCNYATELCNQQDIAIKLYPDTSVLSAYEMIVCSQIPIESFRLIRPTLREVRAWTDPDLASLAECVK